MLPAAQSNEVLLSDLVRIPGAALVALFDATGLCIAMRRTPYICAEGAYRVLTYVSESVPGRSAVTFEFDRRKVLARRLHEDGHAVVVCAAAADAYETEVRLIEAVSGHALRTTESDLPGPVPLVTMTIPPPANGTPSELPPLEASLVLSVGSLTDLAREFDLMFDDSIAS